MTDKRLGKYGVDAIILSQFSLENYGNRLQSHAVIELLREYGLSAIAVAPNEHYVKQLLKDAAKLIIPKALFKKKQRFVLFRRFSKAHAPYLRTPAKRLVEVLHQCKCVVIGSDQVWSPFFLSDRDYPSLYFLNEYPECKKIALSPSFGMPEVPDKMRRLYIEGLSSFARLSVRENTGAGIIMSLCGMEAEVLADPTMAIGAAHWRAIANYSVCPPRRYLLTYYLGSGAEAIKEKAGAFAEQHDLAIIDIARGSEKYNTTGPAELLALIDKADYFITDSFHGTVFSLLFQTDFCVTRRIDVHGRDMFSRIDTLLSKTRCEDRILDATSTALPMSSIEWGTVQEGIDREKTRLKEYLQEELRRCDLL